MSVRVRIQTFTTIMLIVIMIIVNISIYLLFQNLLYSNDLEITELERNQTAEGIHSLSNTEVHDINRFLRAYLPSNGMIRIMKQEQILYTVTKESSYADLPVEPTSSQSKRLLLHEDTMYAITSMPIIWQDGSVVTLEVTDNINSSKEILGILRLLLIAASVIIVVPTFLAGKVLSRVILNPIQQLILTMENIQKEGKFHQIPLQANKKDELEKLKSTFNHMIAILERQYEKQKQFVSDASHELKTPITVIESYSKMLKRWGKKREDVLEESIEAIYSESIHMKNMTNQLLELANADGNWSLNEEKVNLFELSSDIAKKMKMTSNRTIIVSSDNKDAIILADVLKMKQLLYILIDNGFKYGADQMAITLTSDSEELRMAVKDNGDGIALEELSHIFDRFYRVDKARTREVGGVGLGLAIAKEIMNAHNGEIQIDSKLEEGTTFTCIFSKEELGK
ncbi:sensor histidine kinase [Bacillus sp. B1-b2]|uniref:sensor histidine kinase n=1 Tax=Bacillus sp. B1-b2 TaxID=2653201 RepID=UPI0012629AF4|nr:ATP-binding protein [Bacillus sp. B1-b2]KAB7671109.1 HAMP domain-containing histidine kinase [Bacillus sp. B1-b2]